MSTTEILNPTPADLHDAIAMRMTVSRGTLLAALLGPRDLLDERLQRRITHRAQDLNYTLNNIANNHDVEASRARFSDAQYEISRAVTDAGITALGLNALRIMLDDYHREAEFLATLAPAVPE
ncbi:hypothetical protein [Nocardia aurea]|uniref:Uncharacterized protein n=1 Tax=Nocardia aurea TaxID=2144174 RepID=A0ABV3G518_9NOCA